MMPMIPEHRLILENQFAIMEALAAVALEMQTTKYRVDVRPLRRQMDATNNALKGKS